MKKYKFLVKSYCMKKVEGNKYVIDAHPYHVAKYSSYEEAEHAAIMNTAAFMQLCGDPGGVITKAEPQLGGLYASAYYATDAENWWFEVFPL